MKQLLHLLIVNRDRREGLATTHGSRWLLPIACGTERTRAGPLAARWMVEHGLAGHVIGQWLGRVTAANDAMDWLVIVDGRPLRQAAAPPGMRWTPLGRLKSSASLLGYQQWALEKAVPNDLPCFRGPFGSMTWFDAARDWVNVVAGPLTGPPTCYKATPFEVVLGITVARGTVYFKGLAGDRVAEATLTSTLAGELPESFARTLAHEGRAEQSVWWLTAHCAGASLAADFTRERTALVATALGRIQQHFRGRTIDLHIPDADLTVVSAWAGALLREQVSSEAVDRCDAAIARADRAIGATDLPCSWIPLDLDAGNVLVDGESVRFIDLDDSHIGAAPLALATLLRRASRMRARADWPSGPAAIHRAYEECWTPHLELCEQWSDIDIASVLLECHLGWRRLLQKVERGEVYGACDLAATSTAQRLVRALDAGRGYASAHGRR